MNNPDKIAHDMMRKLAEGVGSVPEAAVPDMNPSTPEIETQEDMVDYEFIQELNKKFPQRLVTLDLESFWKRSISFIEQILVKNISGELVPSNKMTKARLGSLVSNSGMVLHLGGSNMNALEIPGSWKQGIFVILSQAIDYNRILTAEF